MNDWIVSKSGRRFKRNSENTGTIMEWNNNGTIKYTIVFDAKYRSKKEYSNTINLPSPYYTNYGGIDFGYERKSPDNYTDDILNNMSICNQDNRTNREATDNLINTIGNNTNYACGYVVRSLTNLSNDGCDLPTINCLTRIWCDAEILDKMDPTIEEYSKYGLTDWFSNKFVWSSSCYGSNFALVVDSNGDVDSYAYRNQNGVIPVYDL